MKQDQAWRLRELAPAFEFFPRPDGDAHPRRIAITSGKGGVGKTTIALNLAILATKIGEKTLLIDGDVNLANIPILSDSSPSYTYVDVLRGHKTLAEIIYEYAPDLHILATGSGILELMDKASDFSDKLRYQFRQLDGIYQRIVIDTASGISSAVFSQLVQTDEILLVTIPEPSAIADAYAIVKIMTYFYPKHPISLIVNMANSEAEAKETFEKFNLITQKFLQRSLKLAGFLLFDEKVRQSTKTQTPYVLSNSNSPFGKNLQQIADKIFTASSTASDLWEERIN
ncbi:hypothetical protein DRP98_07790 [candidate division KSB1 bacterium]|nr:P-loop NTPase [bacterium]RKY83151.1 MAG: hypothetical protein DRP98_07790 [candidate division KSB1 bacterium]